MKKKNILNLIKYHTEKNEYGFRSEAINVARYFDEKGDTQLAEYILSLFSDANVFVPQMNEFKSEFLNQLDISAKDNLYLPIEIANNLKGMVNAVKHNIGMNKFLFEGMPGTGKTEVAKQISRLLNRNLFYVNFDILIDSKLGQTTKNITTLFRDIRLIPNLDQVIILFDEIDALALDRINNNDIREMGRATSTLLKEFDRLSDEKRDVMIIATTNLYPKFDKALIRRFDAVINFDKYNKDDLIEVADLYFGSFIKNFKGISKDTKLMKKILMKSPNLPNPGELKNIIKTALAFSDSEIEYDYLARLYSLLNGDIENKDIHQLHAEGFTVRDIEKLKRESKSNVSRKLNKEENSK